MAGEYWVGRECMGNVIDKMRARASAPEPVQRGSTFGLTARELQMVSTVVAGYPNNDIAAKFSISVKTVKHHLTNIFDKLGVSNRLELALFAVHHRIESGPARRRTATRADRCRFCSIRYQPHRHPRLRRATHGAARPPSRSLNPNLPNTSRASPRIARARPL